MAGFNLAFLNPRLEKLGAPTTAGSSILYSMLRTCSLFLTWNGYNVEQIATRIAVAVMAAARRSGSR